MFVIWKPWKVANGYWKLFCIWKNHIDFTKNGTFSVDFSLDLSKEVSLFQGRQDIFVKTYWTLLFLSNTFSCDFILGFYCIAKKVLVLNVLTKFTNSLCNTLHQSNSKFLKSGSLLIWQFVWQKLAKNRLFRQTNWYWAEDF